MVLVTRPVLLRTGMFARASSLSVKALRLYHDMGLLVPSVVDPDTGYRAYSPAQLNDAAIVRLLGEVVRRGGGERSRGWAGVLPDRGAGLGARRIPHCRCAGGRVAGV